MLKKLFKFVIFLIVLALLALVGVHFYAKKYLNSTEFQVQVITQLEKATHRKAKFGRIDYNLSPFSLLLQDVRIQNKENTAPFVALKELNIIVHLGALLSKKFEIEKIILDSPEINLKQFADGSFDFADMLGTPSPPLGTEIKKVEVPSEAKSAETNTKPQALTESSVSKTLPIDFNIALIQIANAKLTYVKVAADGKEKIFQVPHFDLTIKNISLNKQIDLQIKTAIGSQTTIEMSVGVGPLLSLSPEIANLECVLRGDIEIGTFKDMELFIPEETLKNMPLQSLHLSWNGKGALSKGFDFDVHLSSPQVSEENKVHIDLETALQVNIPAPVLQQIMSNKMSADFQKQIEFKLDGKIIAEAMLVPEQLLSLSCQRFGVNLREDKMTIQNFAFQHKNKTADADTKLVLNGSVTGLNPATSSPVILLETTGDKVVLDQLLNAFPKSAAPQPAVDRAVETAEAKSELSVPEAVSSETSSPVPELDLRSIPFLDKIHFESKTKISQLLYQKNILQDLIVNIVLKQGILTLSPMSFKAYGGSVTDTAELRLLKFPVAYKMNFKMEKIQIQEVLKANQVKDETYGTLLLTLNIEGQGITTPNLKANLFSQGEVLIQNGKRISTDGTLLDKIYLALDNPILLELLPKLATKIQQAKAAQGTKQETVIQDCILSFNLKQGTATLTQCKLGTPDYVLNADGKAYPFDNKLDLKAKLNFSEKATLELTEQKDFSDRLPYENKGLIIPLTLTGSMSKPKVMPDLKTILNKVAGGQVQKALQNLLGAKKKERAATDTVGEKKSSGLTELLGGKKGLSGLLDGL